MVAYAEKEIAVNIFKGFYQALTDDIGIGLLITKWHIAFIAAIATRLVMDAYKAGKEIDK